MTKTITLTAAALKYEGDTIGRDFQFLLLINGQRYLYKRFQLKIGQGETKTLTSYDLGVHLSYEELTQRVDIPVVLMAAELDPPATASPEAFIGAPTTDFGLAARVVSFDFEEVLTYPHTFFIELPVEVQGDFWAKTGREKHKTALLTLFVDVEINWDKTAMETGQLLIMQYQAGRRNFNGELLQQVNLKDAVLPGIDLGEANLLWANLENADLYRADLPLAILRAANLHAAKLENARLSEANLVEAVLDNANLCAADLSYAFINGSCVGCKAIGANFAGAQISSSNFQGADLSGAIFHNAKLDYVDFREANLQGADFTGAIIGKINYDQAKLTDSIGLEGIASTNFDPPAPFEGKSEDYRQGYHEGYERGYSYAIDEAEYDENSWEKSLTEHFPGYTPDFVAGYKDGFLQTYNESWADKG